MAKLRDNPACAEQEFASHADAADPGLRYAPSFDVDADIAAPFIASGKRPRIAVLREQGVNGQVEMAAAFDAAGFAAVDVHMSDILSGRVSLGRFHRARRVRRLQLRRRAGRGRRLGQVDPVQSARARPVRGLLRARRHASHWACATAAR